METWHLLLSGKGGAAWNMALDEALLECAADLGHPVLRFYDWETPSASFGYFQKIADIEKATALRPLVRRTTGGGLVPHDGDWTYSIAFPVGHPWHGLVATASYEKVHRWIQESLQLLHVEANLALDGHHPLPGQCFVGYECHDVLWQCRKIAGAAQRRTKAGLLIQGSVQPPLAWLASPAPLSAAAWHQAMCDFARTAFGVEWHELQLTKTILERTRTLMDQRYSQDTYNRRR